MKLVIQHGLTEHKSVEEENRTNENRKNIIMRLEMISRTSDQLKRPPEIEIYLHSFFSCGNL